MKIKMYFSLAVATVTGLVFLWGINEFSYTYMLILFVVTLLFSYNAVRLYGRHNPEREKRARHVFLWAAFVFYLLFLFLLTFSVRRATPQLIFSSRDRLNYYLKFRCNFVPFKTIRNAFKYSTSFRYFAINILGNLAALAPLGFFLPALFKRARHFLPFTLMAALVVVFIESTQFLFCVGSCDIDDFILNVLGAVVMYVVVRVVFRKAFREN